MTAIDVNAPRGNAVPPSPTPIVIMPGAIVIVPSGAIAQIQTVGNGQVPQSEMTALLTLLTSVYSQINQVMSNIEKSDSDTEAAIVQNLKP
jgi:hypothetical protein